jgi:hypothetical protein
MTEVEIILENIFGAILTECFQMQIFSFTPASAPFRDFIVFPRISSSSLIRYGR